MRCQSEQQLEVVGAQGLTITIPLLNYCCYIIIIFLKRNGFSFFFIISVHTGIYSIFNWHNQIFNAKLICRYIISRGIQEQTKKRIGTLVYQIDVHARLLILRKKFSLHGLILVCMIIVFEKKIPLHVYFPAFLLVFALHVY